MLPEERILSLIPDKQLTKDKITIDTILKIEHYFRSSRSALLYRLKELNIIGKAWILHILMLIVIDIVVVALVSIGWKSLAEIWYIAIRGGLLWIVFYPAAVESIYGPDVRSCLTTFLTVFIVMLLVAATALTTWFLYWAVGWLE